MKAAARRLSGLVVGAAAVTAIAALSRVPYLTEANGHAMLRLSWRARGEAHAHCRRATAAELAGVPAHMRQETVCEGERVAAYRLFAAIDGRPVLDQLAPGSGIAGDRPMYVLREFALAPGRRHLDVRLEKDPADSSERRDDAADLPSGPRRPSRPAVPPRLRLDTTVTVEEHAVLLVTYDAERGRFVLVGGAPDP